MKTGLVSVTFREQSVEKIINIVKKAGLDGIEWGSDVHVPVGDIDNALAVAKLMKKSNLEVLSYGSYYKVGISNNFNGVLKTANALGAKNIRIWAGRKNSEDVGVNEYNEMIKECNLIANMASEEKISVSFEYHGKSFTNTQKSTIKLLQDIKSDNIYTYWQPLSNTTIAENNNNIAQLCLIKKLKNVHVFNWIDGEKLSLANGIEQWKSYIELCKCHVECALLEFVRNDDIDQFYEDAEVLKQLCE